MFINKLDEESKVIKNKARLAAQGYNQQETIDYNQRFLINILVNRGKVKYKL